MAYFTKQQINEISRQLSIHGIKDSQFAKVNTADQTTSFTVLQNGKNALLPVDRLVDHVSLNIDPSKIPMEIPEYEGKNLKAIIKEMVDVIGTRINPIGILASNVGYTMFEGSDCANNVAAALDWIIDILRGIKPFPTAANEEDINGLFITTE